MLEDSRLILTLTIPRFLEDVSFSGIEIFYCRWVNWWLEYGDRDWVKEATDKHWEECDDSRDQVSKHRYAQELLLQYQHELEEHFSKLVSDITYERLPTQIVVKPTGIKGVVLWSII